MVKAALTSSSAPQRCSRRGAHRDRKVSYVYVRTYVYITVCVYTYIYIYIYIYILYTHTHWNWSSASVHSPLSTTPYYYKPPLLLGPRAMSHHQWVDVAVGGGIALHASPCSVFSQTHVSQTMSYQVPEQDSSAMYDDAHTWAVLRSEDARNAVSRHAGPLQGRTRRGAHRVAVFSKQLTGENTSYSL